MVSTANGLALSQSSALTRRLSLSWFKVYKKALPVRTTSRRLKPTSRLRTLLRRSSQRAPELPVLPLVPDLPDGNTAALLLASDDSCQAR